MATDPRQAITLAITGASGSRYALRLLQILLEQEQRVFLLYSKAAQVVMATETALQLPTESRRAERLLRDTLATERGELTILGREQWFSPVASGSNAPRAMVICPCSTGTLAAVAQGMANNLIERAADVMLKERRQLILVPRESPYSEIHLTQMLTLTRMGAVILPASPGFYHQPQQIEDLIDFIVARILDHLQLDHQLIRRWSGEERGQDG